MRRAHASLRWQIARPYAALVGAALLGVIGYLFWQLQGATTPDQIARLRSLLTAAIAGGSLLLLLVILLAGIIARRATRSLDELTRAAAQIAGGGLGARLVPRAEDEIGQLTRAFNQMADRIGAQLAALEAERQKLAAILTEMTDGVVIVDALGTIQLMNPAAAGMFGGDADQGVGRALVEVVRHHQVVELWRACQTSGATESAAIEVSARQLFLQAVAIPFNDAAPGQILLLFQNLSRLRRLETVRRDFISNISHELRTPLASLKALTETLQESALEDPPAARRFLQRMETEVDALSLVVSELLELSRIESGRVPLRLTAIAPDELLTAAAARLSLQAERGGLDLEVVCPSDLPSVLADRQRLEQVLVNLLHNAIKYTPSGGRIEVSARAVDDAVEFAVRDSGVGIPAADLERIFERFYKTDRARASGGTGLGLAIARHLVEAHQGKLWATSREGHGSAFFFTLPRAH